MKELLAALTAAASLFMPQGSAAEYATAVVANWDTALYVEREYGDKAPTIEALIEELFDTRLKVRGRCDWTFATLDRDAVLDAMIAAALPAVAEMHRGCGCIFVDVCPECAA